MKTVQAFKCQFCGKIYENKNSCRTHQNQCYFNPKTSSCATCAYKLFDQYRLPNGPFTKVRTCMLNKDISRRLKTKCSHHISESHPEARNLIQQNQKSYFPDNVVMKHMERIMTLSTNSHNDENELSESYFTMYMNQMIMTILLKMQLKLKHNEIDKKIEAWFECYADYLKKSIAMFCRIGLEPDQIKTVINKVADIWELNPEALDLLLIKAFYANLDNANQINRLNMGSNTNLNKLVNSFEGLRIDGLDNDEFFSHIDPYDKYFQDFLRLVESIDLNFLSHVRLYVEEGVSSRIV